MLTTRRVITDAPHAWLYLNGLCAVYKPSGLTVNRVRAAVVANICRDLNAMKVRPPKERLMIEAAVGGGNSLVRNETNYADHILVVGDRYLPKDFKCTPAIKLGIFSSGLLLLGLRNKGSAAACRIRENHPVRVYHVTGKFGMATETNLVTSPITVCGTFDHISLNKLSSLLASMQSSHQKKMYEMVGIDLQSQAAYELAAQGPLRPLETKIPVIYSLRCIEYKKPYFTIEIHAIHENEEYMGTLINEIGIEMRSVAHCTQIRCIRQAHFTLDDAVVRRNWDAENIISNITRCRKKLLEHPEMLDQSSPTLIENLDDVEQLKLLPQ